MSARRVAAFPKTVEPRAEPRASAPDHLVFCCRCALATASLASLSTMLVDSPAFSPSAP
eukprot:COSAG02_NODE_24114_length_697_cov_1.292642_1_plen_58_part_10